ncbi:MAG: response regulator [Opitutaceae bacterium]|nr:response regulator [Cytophagales bacterium]
MEKQFHCVMLVDDDEISNFISEKIIKNLNITNNVKVVSNGKLALHFVKENCDHSESQPLCPDFILLDINMPVMDGFQFLDEFSKLSVPGFEKIKIIILTSSNNPKDVASAEKYKIDGYINKPLSKEKFEMAMKTLRN